MGLARGALPRRAGSIAGKKPKHPRMPFPGEQSLSPLRGAGRFRPAPTRSSARAPPRFICPGPQGRRAIDGVALPLCPVPSGGGCPWLEDPRGTLIWQECFASLQYFLSNFGGWEMCCGRHEGYCCLVPPFCSTVQHRGATEAAAKGQDRHFSPKRRDSRAPSACPCSQPIRLPGHAASEEQEGKALRHVGSSRTLCSNF